jgi:tripartite-type tricarboxylate transporter receptor subunit TctC
MFDSPPTLSRRACLHAALGQSLIPRTSFAQQVWPTKSLSLVVPFPVGGSNDIAARVLAESLRTQLGQSVVVENKPGANGALGVETVLRGPPDPYTYLVASDSVSLLPLFRSTSWDLSKSFTPVSVLSYQPIVVVTAATSGLRSIKDLAARARSKPNEISYASSGTGSIQHLVGETFAQQLGVDLLHVPYKGGGQALNDVISGQVHAAVLGAAAVLPAIKSGRLVALAVSTGRRSSMLPDTPTLAESGAGSMDVPQWSALFARSGIEDSVITKMRRGVEESLADPALKQRYANAAMEVIPTAPEAFLKRMLEDRERWARLIKDRKISLA